MRGQRGLRGFHFGRGLDGFRGLGGGFGRAGVGGGRFFTGFVDLAVALAQLFFQHLELFLLSLHRLAERFELRGEIRVRFFSRLRRFRLGRLSGLRGLRIGVFR